jgi:hypothetical protein
MNPLISAKKNSSSIFRRVGLLRSREEIQTFRVISRRISCSTSMKGQTNQRHLMKTKILRNIFLSVGVLFASTQLLSAGMNDGVLNFSNTPLVSPQATFITFDAPDGGDLFPSGINPVGAITGTYIRGSYHAFLRAPDGTVTMIDPPGSTGAFVGFFEGPAGQPINPAGAITGTYFDASGIGHGFLRSAKGIVASFDPPGSTYTIPQSINAAGAITGAYFDASGAIHAFLRAPDGTFTTFDAPDGVGVTAGQGINSAGTIVGEYFDAKNFLIHGFVRGSDATITEFDVPDGVNGTQPSGINAAGAITGLYYGENFNTHSFLRAPDGTFTTFDPPGAVGGSSASGINPGGAITGSYFDASGVGDSFVRAPTAPSPLPWMCRAPQARSPPSSTRLASLRDYTTTQTARGTAFCGFRKPICCI